jgi:hypothetical protein
VSAAADDLHDKIVDLLHEMGIAELRSMLYLAERLMLGQRTYGCLDLKTDPRNWKEEQKAEIGDLLVYFAFEELKHRGSTLGAIEEKALGQDHVQTTHEVLGGPSSLRRKTEPWRSDGCQSAGSFNGALVQCQRRTWNHEGDHRAGSLVWPKHG